MSDLKKLLSKLMHYNDELTNDDRCDLSDYIKKLQAENAELKKQIQLASVDITDVKIGSTLNYRNGKDSIVYDISDVVNDGINGGVAQCRIWANVIGGKGVYHTYRKDGVSHYESGYDIVKITPPEGE